MSGTRTIGIVIGIIAGSVDAPKDRKENVPETREGLRFVALGQWCNIYEFEKEDSSGRR